MKDLESQQDDEMEERGEKETKEGEMEEYTAERKELCAPGLATRIHRMVLQRLIPQLHKTLTEKVRSGSLWLCGSGWLSLLEYTGIKIIRGSGQNKCPFGNRPPTLVYAFFNILLLPRALWVPYF
jgi:hypothetical protein